MATIRPARPAAVPDLDPLWAAVLGLTLGIGLGSHWPPLYWLLSRIVDG